MGVIDNALRVGTYVAASTTPTMAADTNTAEPSEIAKPIRRTDTVSEPAARYSERSVAAISRRQAAVIGPMDATNTVSPITAIAMALAPAAAFNLSL